MSGIDLQILGLLVVGGVLAALVSARRGRDQLLATLVAVTALLGLALLPPLESAGKGLVLLTEGATSRLVDDRGRLGSASGVYALGNDPAWPRSAAHLSDIGALTRREDLPGALTIAGHGLDPWDAERLRDSGRFKITAADIPPMPDGVTRISWRRDLAAGRPLVVSGTITGGGTLHLAGPGGRVEQVVSSRTEETPFTLQLVPPGPGRFLFDLSLVRPEGATDVGTLDVDVREAAAPNLLWLERAPSFETRYVKQWLADAGSAVAVRTTISRDRYRYEYHNLGRVDLSRLTLDRLRGFDVVAADAGTWAGLPRSERQAIEQGVRAGTLGVVLRLALRDGAPARAPFGVTVRRIAGLDRLMIRPAAMADPPSPIAIPPFELESPGAPVFQDRAGRVLAIRRPLGSGSVALTTLTDSYRWVLEGRPDAHRAYWIALLEAATPPDDRPRWLLPGGPIPEHEPLTATLAGDLPIQAELIEPDGRRATVPMRQHPTRPDRFSAVLWPRLTGWHRLEAGDAVALFHATPGPEWAAWRATRRRDATALATSEVSFEAPHARARTPWARLLAFALLIAALAWAWIAERLSGA